MLLNTNKGSVMFCKARGLAVLSELSVFTLLFAQGLIAFWLGYGDRGQNAIEFVIIMSLTTSFLYSFSKISRYPHQYSAKSKFKLESAEQVIERCIRHIHDILIPLSCALAVIVVFSLFYIVWFQAQIIGGFFEWIDK